MEKPNFCEIESVPYDSWDRPSPLPEREQGKRRRAIALASLFCFLILLLFKPSNVTLPSIQGCPHHHSIDKRVQKILSENPLIGQLHLVSSRFHSPILNCAQTAIMTC